MKKVIGILIAIVGIALGIYVGVWLMFVGGIVQIVNSINPLNGLGIALGIVRIVFCEVGVLIAWLGIAIGSVIGLED
nr:MAG TPA: hypothetical protein [Caudoviricetes sp.]